MWKGKYAAVLWKWKSFFKKKCTKIHCIKIIRLIYCVKIVFTQLYWPYLVLFLCILFIHNFIYLFFIQLAYLKTNHSIRIKLYVICETYYGLQKLYLLFSSLSRNFLFVSFWRQLVLLSWRFITLIYYDVIIISV